MLGSDLIVLTNQMDQYWHKELDYKYGFCYSFQPPDGEHGVIKISTEPAALNLALMRLNVSCYIYDLYNILLNSMTLPILLQFAEFRGS